MLEILPKFLYNRQDQFLGIFATRGICFLTELREHDQQWKITFAEQIPLESRDDDEDLLEELAGQIKMCCMKEHLTCNSLILCMGKEEVFGYEKEFPDMPMQELREAACWEMEANVPFEANSYLQDFHAMGQGKVFLAAVEKEHIMSVIRSFENNGLKLLCLTVETGREDVDLAEGKILAGGMEFMTEERTAAVVWEHGQCLSLFAAAWPLFAVSGINLLPPQFQPEKLVWKKLSIGLFLAGALFLAAVYGMDAWQLYELERQQSEAAYELSFMHNVIQEKEDSDKAERVIQRKKDILIDLSQKGISWYALMVHLGTITVEDVWLTDLSLSEGNTLDIQGRAVDYNALGEFLQRFEQDKEFFTENPVLRHSSIGKDNLIKFSVQIKL